MESKDISIVIVTFKSEDIISKCLKSIPNDIKVIIVENSKNEKSDRYRWIRFYW